MRFIRTLAAASALVFAGAAANAAVVTITFDSAVANYTPTPGVIQNVKSEFAPLGIVFNDLKTPGEGATLGQCGPGSGPVSFFGHGNDFPGCGDTQPNIDIDFVNPGNSALDGYTTFFSIWNYDGLVEATAFDGLGNILGTRQTASGALTFSGIGNISRVNLKSLDNDPTTMDTLEFEAVIGVGNAVPEPATWAMMISGLAMVGFSMRRRRATVSFA